MTHQPDETGSLAGETLQTPAPLRRIAQDSGSEPVEQVALRTPLVLDPPYQRGSVWGALRRRNLIRSMLLGIPIGKVFLNRRSGEAQAVVDGRQRIETCRMFLRGELSVPHSWFPAQYVITTEQTEDGPYLYYPGLSPLGQGLFSRCVLDVQRTAFDTVEQEAELFNLINFGGLLQGVADTDR